MAEETISLDGKKPVQRGFTLVEGMVSMGIIALITTLVFTNFRYGGQTGDLNYSAQKLVSDIRLIQSYSLGLKEYNGEYPGGGWGIRLSSQSPHDKYYLIYLNKSLTTPWDTNNIIYKTEDYASTGVEVEGRLRYFDGSSWAPCNYAFVSFEPPDPIIRIGASNNDDPPPWGELAVEILEITLIMENTALTKKVILNNFGLVDIIN